MSSFQAAIQVPIQRRNRKKMINSDQTDNTDWHLQSPRYL